MIRSGLILMIKDLAAKGKSAYAIGREIGVSKNTARKYMQQPEYSVFPEPGVRRVRATIPAGQSQCSGRREPVSFPLLLCITTGCAEHGGQGCCAMAAMPVICFLSRICKPCAHEYLSHHLLPTP